MAAGLAISLHMETDVKYQHKPLIYIVIGEESGDQLGARAVAALNAATSDKLRYAGLAGGERMQGLGLTSLFPLSEIAVMGIVNIIKQYPSLHRRGMEVVEEFWPRIPICF